MTVELDSPFVWPEEPTDLEPWGKEVHDSAADYSEDINSEISLPNFQKRILPPSSERRQNLAKQAKALLSGKEKWQPTWQALGRDQDLGYKGRS